MRRVLNSDEESRVRGCKTREIKAAQNLDFSRFERARLLKCGSKLRRDLQEQTFGEELFRLKAKDATHLSMRNINFVFS